MLAKFLRQPTNKYGIFTHMPFGVCYNMYSTQKPGGCSKVRPNLQILTATCRRGGLTRTACSPPSPGAKGTPDTIGTITGCSARYV